MRTYPLNPLCNYDVTRQKRETGAEIQSEDDPEYGIRLLLGGAAWGLTCVTWRKRILVFVH